MKEKLLKMKVKVLQNKKKSAAIGIAVLLLIGAGGYGIAVLSMNNNETVMTAQTTKKLSDQKSVKKETTTEVSKKTEPVEKKDVQDKKTDEKKSSDDKKETKKTEPVKKEEKKENVKENNTKPANTNSVDHSNKPAGNTNTNTGNNSSSGGNTNIQSTQPSVPQYTPEPDPVPQPPVHTHNFNTPVYSTNSVYVVDTPAWTETVSEPVYGMVEHTICSTCKADISGFAGQHLDETMHGGYYSDWRHEQTGTNTYTVDHPEVGHYETEQVITGYQCSCGAVQ